MKVSELRDRMSGTLIDRAGNFSSLNMNDAGIHVRGCECGGKRFVAVANEKDNIWSETLEFAGKFHDPETE
jgi:hypothetical protein